MFSICGASQTQFPRLAGHFHPVSGDGRKASNPQLHIGCLNNNGHRIIFLEEFPAPVGTSQPPGGDFSVHSPSEMLSQYALGKFWEDCE